MDEIEFIYDPLKMRVEDLAKLSKACDESFCSQMKEILLSAAKVILSEIEDYHKASQNPPAELHAFPGGKH